MLIVDELKEMFNMSESRQRSHVGMGVAFWQAGRLRIIGAFPREMRGIFYRSTRVRFAKRRISFWNCKRTEVVGPLRFFAIISSATFLLSFSSRL